MRKIWKPAVASKKVAEIFENGCKQKVAEKSLNQRLKVQKLLKNLKTSGWKQKRYLGKIIFHLLKMWTKKCDLAVEQIVNFLLISYSELRRV